MTVDKAIGGKPLTLVRGQMANPNVSKQELAKKVASPDVVEKRAGKGSWGRRFFTPLPTKNDLAKVEAERPKIAINLLTDIEMNRLSPEVHQHLLDVQSLLNRSTAKVLNYTFTPAAKQMGPKQGISDKLLLDGRAGPTLQGGRFLFKTAESHADARRNEFVTVLANLLGVETPLVLVHHLGLLSEDASPVAGVCTELLSDVTEQRGYDLSKASPEVIDYILKTRWFNDVVGNLDVWWKQMLVPVGEEARYERIVQIDFDESFGRMPAEELRTLLVEHWGHPKERLSLDYCGWRDRCFEMEAPTTWAPGHFDSRGGFYSDLWKGYLEGEIELDVAGFKEHLNFLGELPKEAIGNAMEKFLEVSSRERDGMVHMPGADPSQMPVGEFKELFVERFDRSRSEFSQFLDTLEQAKQDPSHPMALFYQTMEDRRL